MDNALKTMIENMPEKTGKQLDEWLAILKNENFEKHSLAVKYLKEQHGVTHGYANTIVTLAKQENHSGDDLIVNQYQGKASLIPIYDALIATVTAFGDDVTVSPKKGSVSIIRKNQFALIKPATKSRIDLGLKLKGVAVQGRLEDSGPFGSMCTHRIQLTDVADLDSQVNDWLLLAYQKSV